MCPRGDRVPTILPTLPESRLSSPREGRERAQDRPADGEDVAAPPERQRERRLHLGIAGDAQVQPPFTLPFRRGGHVLTVGWAILRPLPAFARAGETRFR